jgi:hypothetical protein
MLERARRWTAWPLTLAILAVSAHGAIALQRDPLLQKERWDLAAQTIARLAQPGDAVAAPNDYYAIAAWLALDKRWPIEAVVCRTLHEQLADEDRVRANVRRLFAEHPRVWYMDHDRALFDPTDLVPRVFADEGVEVTRGSFPQTPQFSLRLYAANPTVAAASLSGVVDFRNGDFASAQASGGFIPGPAGFRWMGEAAQVTVARAWREDVAFACLYAHTPYFTAGPPRFTLWADDEPLRDLRVEASDLHCLEGVLPPDAAARSSVTLRLTVDRVFIPDEVLGDGDRTPRSALVQRIGVTRSGTGWEVR